MKFFWCQGVFFLNFDLKNHAADSEIEFLTKSISKPNGRATAMPTAWELNSNLMSASMEKKFLLKNIL